MKRNGIALIVHPFKNALASKEKLREYCNKFAEKLLVLTKAHPNLRINLTMPGYIMQLVDPLIVSQLNEVQKSNCLEWLTTGFTEPFISFSPLWLSDENIKYGLETFQELVSTKPTSFIPPFSNWEPSFVESLKNNGITSVVLSRNLLPQSFQPYCGYWITENNGITMSLVPAHTLHYYNAPADILNWVQRQIENHQNYAQTRILTLDYLIPLVPDILEINADPFKWLSSFADSLDTLLIPFQMVLMRELPGLAYPLGLQYLPPSLNFKDTDCESMHYFANNLFTYDLVGILQRKMLDIADKVKQITNIKESLSFKKDLFYIQDINRFLPNRSSGIMDISDRCWTFSKMINIEHELLKREPVKDGQIKIADVQRNGIKSIVLSNNSLKTAIDYKNGAQVLWMDYFARHVNICATVHPDNHLPPRVVAAGKSRTSFIDHFLPEDCQLADFINSSSNELSDFVTGDYEYRVKKVDSGIKAILTRQGFLLNAGKAYPVTVEKVLGLEGNKPELSFAYQLSNYSLTPYRFKFAIECNFALPGALTQHVEISCDGKSLNRFLNDRMIFEQTTKWIVSDRTIGVAMEIVTQKPVSLWCFPITSNIIHQGTTMVLSIPVALGENAVWSFVGKISLKKVRIRRAIRDVI